MTCTPDEIAGKILGAVKGMGKAVPSDALKGLDTEGQGHYSAMAVKFDNALAEDIDITNPHLPESEGQKALGPIGFVKGFLSANTHPTTVLGEDFTAPLLEALQQHKLSTSGNNPVLYKSDVLPIVKELQARVEEHFADDMGKQNFANEWLQYWKEGGRFYRVNQDSKLSKVLLYPVRTAAGNLVSFSPFIASAHTFQLMPKAMGLYGLRATAMGTLELAGQIAQHGFKAIPELADQGLVHQAHGLEKANMVIHADNMAKGFAYYVGKAAKEDPMKAVETIAYQDRIGNEPWVMRNPQNAQAVYLMRFALGGMRMYGGWYKNIIQGAMKGDLAMAAKGAKGLALFTAGQSLMTGTKSAIPAPIWHLMSDEDREYFEQLDESLPYLNLLKKVTHIDVGEHLQPVGGIALGAGYQIANTGFTRASKNFTKGVEDVRDEDYTRAGVDFVKSGLAGAQSLVPGLGNASLQKVWGVLGDIMTGDTEKGDAVPELAKKFKFLP